MSLTGTLNLSLSVVGVGAGGNSVNEQDVLAVFQSVNSPAVRITQALSGGLNTITAPAAAPFAQMCIIVPPTTSGNTKTLRGVSGDTGLTFVALPVMIPLGTVGQSNTSCVINSAGVETVTIYFI